MSTVGSPAKTRKEARDFEGAFYTPLPFAQKAVACLEKQRLEEIEEIKKQLGAEINGEALDLGISAAA